MPIVLLVAHGYATGGKLALENAARRVALDTDRTYINTGAWSDLIPSPPLGSDEDAKRFIDKLEANKVPLQHRLTWAYNAHKIGKFAVETPDC